MRYLVLFILCIFFSCNPSKHKSQLHIHHRVNSGFGGDLDPTHPLVKAIVPLRVLLPRGWSYCTGIITGWTTVLTAGHCLKGAKEVWVGFSYNNNDPYHWIQSWGFQAHPQFFFKTGNNDLAIIRVAQLLNNYHPIGLVWHESYYLNKFNYINDMFNHLRLETLQGTQSQFIQFGWGKTESGYSPRLRYLRLFFGSQVGESTFGFFPPTGSQTDNGDSGGPIVMFNGPSSPFFMNQGLKVLTWEAQLFAVHSKGPLYQGDSNKVIGNILDLAQRAGWSLFQ